ARPASRPGRRVAVRADLGNAHRTGRDEERGPVVGRATHLPGRVHVPAIGRTGAGAGRVLTAQLLQVAAYLLLARLARFPRLTAFDRRRRLLAPVVARLPTRGQDDAGDTGGEQHREADHERAEQQRTVGEAA